MKTLVCDIDNTVADQIRRLIGFYDHELERLDAELAYSAAAIENDTTIEGAVIGVNHFKNQGYKIIWLTARKQELKEATHRWLIDNNFPVDELILVDKLNDKIAIIQALSPDIIIDDCQYNLDKIKPLPATNFIKSIKEKGFNLIVFKNNWLDIIQKYNT